MKIDLLCLNREQYGNILNMWLIIKNIIKKYDNNCTFVEYVDVYSIDIVNKSFNTNINNLPAVLIYSKYYYDKHNIYDTKEHIICYLNNQNDINNILLICYDYYKEKLIKDHESMLNNKLQFLHETIIKYTAQQFIDRSGD